MLHLFTFDYFHVVGHTITGDYTYSNRQDTKPYRMMLHAHHMSIPVEPFTSQPLVAEDPFITDSNWQTEQRICDVEQAIHHLSVI